MTASLSDLLSVPTKDAMIDYLVSLARLAGFPTASWQSGSVARTLFEGEAANLADLAATVRNVAMGGLLDYAEGAWLDLLGVNVFNEVRKAAIFTRQTLTLTATLGAGPFTVTPGSYWVTNASKTLRFVALTGGTVPLSGSLTIEVQAESPGAAYNLAAGTITEQVTPLVGVTVTNPGGTTGTAITQQGADVETDEAYRQRCRDKWATLGSGSNAEAYRYWATSSSAEVTRTRVVEDRTTGSVTLVIAGPSGPVTPAAYATVAAAVEAKRPLGVVATTVNAAATSVPIIVTIFKVPGTTTATVYDAVRASLDAYVRTTDIGGLVYRSKVIEAIQATPGVQSMAVDNMEPSNTFQLTSEGVWTPSYSLLIAG